MNFTQMQTNSDTSG